MPKKLTSEAFEKFKRELEELKVKGRKEIKERLKHTASFGDLSENFAYQQAKDDQAFIERRIAELEALLNQSIVIEKKQNKKVVDIGSCVTVIFGGKKEKYKMVEPEETNLLEGKISSKSPLGQAIFGKKTGEEIEVNSPKGKVKCKILKIE